jgi:hypothetical protein
MTPFDGEIAGRSRIDAPLLALAGRSFLKVNLLDAAGQE